MYSERVSSVCQVLLFVCVRVAVRASVSRLHSIVRFDVFPVLAKPHSSV